MKKISLSSQAAINVTGGLSIPMMLLCVLWRSCLVAAHVRCVPGGLHGARLRQEEEKKKKKGRTVIGPQSIKEKGEGGVSENDVMGVAVRPRPVGDRREWLLVEVCGREG